MEESDFEWDEEACKFAEDWDVIESVLPSGWEDAARRTGALIRTRGFENPAVLLRVLLIHLVEGCSLRETAVRAAAGGLAKVSDVALLGRLRGSGEWFRWMAEAMSERLCEASQPILPGRRVRLVDASVVCEPGATGSTWRVHYMIDLSSLACEQVEVTLPDEGETLSRFAVQPGDVLMADRGLAHRAGIGHVVRGKGDVIVRMNLVSVPLEDAQGRAMHLLPRLRKLTIAKPQGWQALIRDGEQRIPVRVCALKKSAEQTCKAQATLRRIASKKGRTVQPDTLEAAGYVIVLTTLPDTPAQTILELYRHRWQIELAFKRLKSLLHLGHLKKTDQAGARAWLQGKLFVAALIETLIALGERFSPWGYFLPKGGPAPVPMA